MLKALVCAGLDARKILEYREKLQQCMRVFGVRSPCSDSATLFILEQLQSAISLRNAVANLIAHQTVRGNELGTSIGPYMRPADFSAAHHFLLLLTANLRKNAVRIFCNRNRQLRFTSDRMAQNLLQIGRQSVTWGTY
jgi:hypothetical protein